MSDQETSVEMAAIRMPSEQMDFIRRNQKVAEKTGKIIVMLSDMQKTVQGMKELFKRPELFKEYLENGTEEELAKFLSVCGQIQDNPDSIFHAKNIPEEAFDKIVSKMGDHVVATKTEDLKLFKRKHEQQVTGENS